MSLKEQKESYKNLKFAKEISEQKFNNLLENLKYLSSSDIEQIRKAWICANEAHKNQWRTSGEPYITHPIAVAKICAGWKLDSQTIMSALLHDSLEDCEITKKDLINQFDLTVANLVDGLTKLDKLKFDSKEEGQAESFRKMLVAMIDDIRVILVKLADRTHNMRTMEGMPAHKSKRISLETLEIYVPLAYRLGLNQVYRELQDLSFKYLFPWRYKTLEKALNKVKERRRVLITKIKSDILKTFDNLNINLELIEFNSTLFSIYRKMISRKWSFARLLDIYNFRLIVNSNLDCYLALGILHKLFKPIPGKFKDFISLSKDNGYQSLHTSLIGPAELSMEFQIKTQEMYILSEFGIVTYWKENLDKDDNKKNKKDKKNIWLQSLLDIENESKDSRDFWDNIKIGLLPDDLYVFSPKGKSYSFQRGATALDFAYAIHTDIGDHANTALVNSQSVSIKTELKNGDIVEIITDKNINPQIGWLDFLKTGKARTKVKNYLKNIKNEEAIILGEKLLIQALRKKGIINSQILDYEDNNFWNSIYLEFNIKDKKDLLLDIGLGRIIVQNIAKNIAEKLILSGKETNNLLLKQKKFNFSLNNSIYLNNEKIILDNKNNNLIHYSDCCTPIPGDLILGYLNYNEGLFIHHKDCKKIRELTEKNTDLFIPVEWSEDDNKLYKCNLKININNKVGALAKITNEISSFGINIVKINFDDNDINNIINLTLMVHNIKELTEILNKLKKVEFIIKINRL